MCYVSGTCNAAEFQLLGYQQVQCSWQLLIFADCQRNVAGKRVDLVFNGQILMTKINWWHLRFSQLLPLQLVNAFCAARKGSKLPNWSIWWELPPILQFPYHLDQTPPEVLEQKLTPPLSNQQKLNQTTGTASNQEVFRRKNAI